MTMRRAKAGAALAALVVAAAGHLTGDDAPSRGKATLEFRVMGTAAGAATFPIGSVIESVNEGESTTLRGQVKLFPAPEGSACKNIGVEFGPNDVPEGKLPLWEIRGVVHRVEMDRIQIGYEWKRMSAPDGGSPAAVSDRGEVTLTEGAHVLLDFVPVWEASSGCFRNLALELAASIPEDAAFKDRRVGYDLWLVSEDHGKPLTRRLQLMGKQGENVTFDYGVFRSKLPAAPRTNKGSDLLETTVSGSIRSRIQTDGSIDLYFVAYRTVQPGDHHWGTAASGQKRLRARPGETLRLELPPPAPFHDVDEPDTFSAIAEQRVALILTPTVVE